MKSKQKIVYYCDFCTKKGLRKSSVKKHEESCTMNPNRKCNLCGRVGLVPKNLDDESCPICHFARLRQTEWGENSFYDLEGALKKYWEEKNKDVGIY